MSRPDGYEELPGGTEPLDQAVAPPLGSLGAPNEPAAGTPQPPPAWTPGGGVAAGVPAAAPRLAHQALGGGSGLQQLPPFPQHLAELPGAAEEWDRNAVFCSVWLGVSSATLALALLVLSLLGIAAGACATIAAATHRFQRCREGLSLADAVHRMLRLAIAAACIAGFISMASALAAFFLSTACPSAHDKDVCARLSGITTLSALWYAFFTGLNAEAAHRAARMRRLLNPVSSGVVTV